MESRAHTNCSHGQRGAMAEAVGRKGPILRQRAIGIVVCMYVASEKGEGKNATSDDILQDAQKAWIKEELEEDLTPIEGPATLK